VTELQVTGFFGSTYALHLIAEGLATCPFSGSFFVRLTVLPLQGFEVSHPIFDDVANVANGKAYMKLETSRQTNAVQQQSTMMIYYARRQY